MEAARAQLLLAEDIAQFYDDPLGHVLYSYPWGEGSLKGRDGPQKWQREYLEALGEQVRERGFNGIDPVPPIQNSTASGHGIGKSALVGWIIRWIMDTRPFAKGVVTANTGEQLRTKTWSELAKWHNLGITKEWWELTSGSGSLSYYHKEHREQWRCDGQTCREENSESFAGLHAANSTPFYIFDEASAVPDKIFEVREGGLTDGEPMTFDFGNPTRNSGRFHANMKGKFRDQYTRRVIDSRDVEQTNKELFKKWAEMYGEDSDFFKVRVKGEFPTASSLQFIPTDYYDDNVMIDVHVGPRDPLIMGVDVARFGDDNSVIWIRHGRDAEIHGPKIYKGVDTMTLASEVARLAGAHNPDAVLIDGGGVGGGVVDRARQLGVEVIEVNFGGKAPERGFANMRSYMWSRMRDALRDGVSLPEMEDLKTDLIGVEYGYRPNNDLTLESKQDMKRRGMKSPDLADALALTYAQPVMPRSRAGYDGVGHPTQHEFDPFD